MFSSVFCEKTPFDRTVQDRNDKGQLDKLSLIQWTNKDKMSKPLKVKSYTNYILELLKENFFVTLHTILVTYLMIPADRIWDPDNILYLDMYYRN